MFNQMGEQFIEYIRKRNPKTLYQMEDIIFSNICARVFDFYFNKGVFNDLVSAITVYTHDTDFIKNTIKSVFDLCYAIAKSDGGVETVKRFCDEHPLNPEYKEMYKYIIKIKEV